MPGRCRRPSRSCRRSCAGSTRPAAASATTRSSRSSIARPGAVRGQPAAAGGARRRPLCRCPHGRRRRSDRRPLHGRARLGLRLHGRGRAPRPGAAHAHRPRRRLATRAPRSRARTGAHPGGSRDRSRRHREGARRRSLCAARARGDGSERARQPRRRHRAGGARSRGRLADPRDRRPPQRCDREGQTIALAGGGLATSSTTVRRWRAGDAELHHIVDPRTGAPAAEVWRTSASPPAPASRPTRPAPRRSCAARRRVAWLERAGLPARLVRRDGATTYTCGWPEEAAA